MTTKLNILKNLKKGSSFKIRKITHEKDSKYYILHKRAKAIIEGGNLIESVQFVKILPEDKLEDWIAANTVDFFNHANLIYGTIREYCTPHECPSMTAGEKYEYFWTEDGEKPVSLTAADYVEKVMIWIQSKLDDHSIFPRDEKASFPANYMEIVSKIYKRLFRIYAHIYYAHYNRIVLLELEPHMNTVFLHFYLFVEEFDLFERKEMVPLDDVIKNLLSNLKDYTPKKR